MEDTDWVGKTYISTFGWDVLEDIVDIGPRLGGSRGEEQAHGRVLEAFDAAGCRQLQRHPFDIDKWERGTSSLATDTPYTKDFDCISLPGSPPAELTGDVIHLGHGLREDFERADIEDKIVVVRSDVPSWYDRWIHRQEKYGLAIEHGAKAFVFANHVEGSLAPTGSLANGPGVIGEIPGIGVSKEIGAQLRRYTEKSDVQARLSVDVRTGDTESRNVTGVVGPDTKDEILVGAHVDGHDISQAAIDNGAGVAIMCEIARILGQRENELDTKVRFIGFGSEEIGLAGSRRAAERRDLSRIKAMVNLDGIGDGRKQKIQTNGFDEFHPLIDAVAAEFRHPTEWVPTYMVHSDHWPFVAKGVPGIIIKAESDYDGRGFAHTTADTLEKVDIRNLRTHAILAASLIEKISRMDVDPKTQNDIEDDLLDRGRAEDLQLSGDWPYS